MSWPVGTIVVCVDDSPSKSAAVVIGSPLVAGHHFTVRGWSGVADENSPGVLLYENRGDVSHRWSGDGCHDWPWNKARFRLAEGGACESERARQMSEVRA